jgi:MFS family permease
MLNAARPGVTNVDPPVQAVDDTTIANVALRYISGGLAVSSDEASWVVTTYLVANSVLLWCASVWIAEILGRKNFFLICMSRRVKLSLDQQPRSTLRPMSWIFSNAGCQRQAIKKIQIPVSPAAT